MPRTPSHPVCDVIACEICLKEIPRDLAKSSESAEYVHYFCGEECFARWQRDESDAKRKKPG
ncbi:MAG TPA: DUF3330 domain-containing protein [Gammaproteobacteria bacterium]|nr:DUF3330 domain-containing protein [Gammaproteobacteria bacterium]